MNKFLSTLAFLFLVTVPAYADYAFVASKVQASATGASFTSSGSDMTGVNLIVACVASFETVSVAFSDDQSNVYTALTERCRTGDVCVQAFYKQAPTVAMNMTFTATCTGGDCFPAIAVLGFSGSVATPADQESAGATTAGSTTLQPGSITPTETKSLLVACLGFGAAATITADGGYSSPPAQANYGTGTNYGVAASYLIQTDIAAANPTFTASVSVAMAADQESFKDSGVAGGGSSSGRLLLLGVQ